MLVACFLFLFSSPIFAQLSYAVNPLKIEMEVERGKMAQFFIDVYNAGPADGIFKIYPVDFEITPEGNIRFPEAGTSKWSCASWIQMNLEEYKLHLKAREGKRVVFALRIPRSARGGRYAAIMVEPVRPEKKEGSVAVIELPMVRMATLLLVTVRGRGKLERAEIKNISVNQQNGTLVFTVAVHNKGNIHFVAEGKLRVLDKSGRRWAETSLTAGGGTVLPGGTRNFTGEITKVLPPGEYVAKAEIKYTERRKVFAQTSLTVEEKLAKVGEVLPVDFVVEPEELKIELPFVNQKIHRRLGIKVSSKEPVPIHVKVEPKDIEGLDPQWSATQWIEVKPQEFDVPPNKSKNIAIEASLPRGMEGGRYTQINISATINKESQPTGQQVLLVLTTPGTLLIDAEITQVNVENETLLIELYNKGNVHFMLKSMEVSIRDKKTSNLIKKEVIAKNKLILPGKEQFRYPLSSLEPGTYVIEIKVSYNGKSTSKIYKYTKK